MDLRPGNGFRFFGSNGDQSYIRNYLGIRNGQASRKLAMSVAGSAVNVWSRSHSCLRAVESSERIVAKSSAPCSDRNPPEIFCRNFIIRPVALCEIIGEWHRRVGQEAK